MDSKKIKEAVKENYSKIAVNNTSCCGPKASLCCGGDKSSSTSISKSIGYSDEDITSVPDSSNLGLGCGNPLAFETIKGGETILDLGSGAGFDCFIAANRVGKNGKVIGVDMTPEMIKKANENLKKSQYKDIIEFRLGEIEKLPVDSDTVDLVISNCVINLSPDKDSVFKEIYRVLKPAKHFVVSDIVLSGPLPEKIKASIEAYVSCVAGAVSKDEYLNYINKSGFTNVSILKDSTFNLDFDSNDPIVKKLKEIGFSDEETQKLGLLVHSITVRAEKK